MVPINFNQLYYFWTTAKAGSIVAAARRLLLSPSTVSQQLKQLETALGRRLLLKSRQGAALTEEGRLALDFCDGFFSRSEELASRLRAGAPGRGAIFRLAVGRSVSSAKILDVTRFIKKRAPGMLIKVVSGEPAELGRMLDRRTADAALCDVDIASALGRGFRGRLAASIPHYFAASPRLKVAAEGFPAVLSRAPLLLRSAEVPMRKDVDHFLGQAGVLPQTLAEVENPDLILTMVLNGEGVGVLDVETVRRYERQGRLARLHHRPVGLLENLWLVCRQQEHPDPATQAVLEPLMGCCRLGARA